MLVLLHGLGTGPEAWGPQVEAFGGVREVHTPRLRLDRRFTVSGEAERLWDELPDRPVELCGLSLGALVALCMAAARPERVPRLVLCAGFARLPRRYRLLQAVLGTAVSFAPARARAELGGLDGPTIRAVFREGRRFDASARLDRLTMPTLVLVGEHDRANTPLARSLAQSLPDARLEIVSGAGHVANVDAPAIFTATLRAFVDG
jgi:3-oxoadipate enol-lactonase